MLSQKIRKGIKLQRLPNLDITTCIPNCETCPGQWTNHLINHKIVCLCCNYGHRNNGRANSELSEIEADLSNDSNDNLQSL